MLVSKFEKMFNVKQRVVLFCQIVNKILVRGSIMGKFLKYNDNLYNKLTYSIVL